MSNMNAVVWFDIFVTDMARAVAFYETVMDTKLEQIVDPTGESEMMSFPAEMTAYGAGGALNKMPEGQPGVGGTIVYFSSADVAVEQARVEAAGGQVIREKFSIGEFGFIMMCMDTEGNMIGFNSMK